MKKTAVYPGSFDPVTNGHIDIVKRACSIFDEVIVGVLENCNKKPIFSVKKRVELAQTAIRDFPNVRVVRFSGLLAEYMKKANIKVAIRGLRAVSDLEYEFQLAHTNRMLYPEMETVFLMPNARYVYLTSTIVREVASLGGELKADVPAHVLRALKKKFCKK